uniref:Uncharacterized protein n=1 Tax=Oryza nivara TaxID=4536 RepID=A0A0E0G737_ORYNI
MWAAAQVAAADAAGGERRRATAPRGGGRWCTGADGAEARGEAASPETAARGSRSARGPWLVSAVKYTQSPEEEDAEETDDDEEAAAELEPTLAVGTAASVKKRYNRGQSFSSSSSMESDVLVIGARDRQAPHGGAIAEEPLASPAAGHPSASAPHPPAARRCLLARPLLATIPAAVLSSSPAARTHLCPAQLSSSVPHPPPPRHLQLPPRPPAARARLRTHPQRRPQLITLRQ